MSWKIFMLIWVEHENSFVTSGPDYFRHFGSMRNSVLNFDTRKRLFSIWEHYKIRQVGPQFSTLFVPCYYPWSRRNSNYVVTLFSSIVMEEKTDVTKQSKTTSEWRLITWYKPDQWFVVKYMPRLYQWLFRRPLHLFTSSWAILQRAVFLGMCYFYQPKDPLHNTVFSPIGQEYPFLQVSEIFLSRPAISA